MGFCNGTREGKNTKHHEKFSTPTLPDNGFRGRCKVERRQEGVEEVGGVEAGLCRERDKNHKARGRECLRSGVWLGGLLGRLLVVLGRGACCGPLALSSRTNDARL